MRGVVTVLLPGTGSDDDYVYRAFAGPLEQAGAVVISVTPEPGRLVDGYLEALDRALNAARNSPGIRSHRGRRSVAGRGGGRRVGVGPPPAHGCGAGRAAAVDRRAGRRPGGGLSPAHRPTLRRDGLEATTAAMQASSPQWLADELTRSWRRQWPALPDAMEEAAAYVAPDAETFAG